MLNTIKTYEALIKWKEAHLFEYVNDTASLNQFHDEIMIQACNIAVEKVKKVIGKPPCNFAWFLTGSGGREEQGVISDQDHGIVFESDFSESQIYFKKLGSELADGLKFLGYPYCDGKIMSSNSLWCQSIDGWEKQLKTWMHEMNWEAIRYLQIFFDSRTVVGNDRYIHQLKKMIVIHANRNGQLLKRFQENMQYYKRAIGPLGQLFVQTSGKYEGCLDVKQTAFLPYVNAIRLLAIKEGVMETSTINRLNNLVKQQIYRESLDEVRSQFVKLLDLRLSAPTAIVEYDDGHYLNVKTLSKAQKKELKKILRVGKFVHHYAQALIEKGEVK
ncbi:DUF294 nucleotidyltransferase-like domain-containing protein [Metabacillus malikii]|uniref:CBS domain-containing protein n=1 Tax=Metabacillus malikii TaxID=1504265 RepID=A0ABT9ZBB7_9BACI|nr:DUF294 nucleotidyltransferase-like domain-containing protein [Metabacillus malikii]MDQ0229557.1 CBS domain-containing protein [Metabacillus malikii]